MSAAAPLTEKKERTPAPGCAGISEMNALKTAALSVAVFKCQDASAE